VTRLAFAGAGRISAVHGLAAQALGVPVDLVASRHPERAAQRAAQLGARAVGYDDLPGGTDVVVVSTPPARHVPDALAALHGGAGAIVEKPLATTLAAADQLVDGDEAGGGRIGYAENLAFAPVVLRACSIARSIGPLRHVEARMLQGRPDWGDFLTEGWGGGALFDLGAHPLAVVLLLADAGPGGTDRVERVRARLEGEDDVPVDTYAEVTLTFASGLHARVETSWRDRADVVDLQAASDDGVVRAELLPTTGLEHNGAGLPLPAPRPGLVDDRLDRFGYVQQMDDLLADLGDRRTPEIGARFGRAVLELTCAAYASAGTGSSEVPIPFEGRRDATPLELWRGA
jgi:predicted dehydrogenase